MELENVIAWMEAGGYDQWRLVSTDGKKIDEYIGGDPSFEDSFDKIQTVIALLPTGKYLLKAHTGFNKQAGQRTFPFEVQPRPRVAARAIQARQDTPAGFDYNEFMRKAIQEAEERIEQRMFREGVIARLNAIEADILKLKDVVYDLSDEDPDNDENAFQKLSRVGEQLPGLVKGFESMKGFLGGK